MRRAAFLLAGAIGVLSCGPALAQAAGQWSGSAQIWDRTCGYCHQGSLAPAILGRRIPGPALLAIVRAGPNGMPAFLPSQLSDREITELAGWLARQKPATRPDSR